MKAVDLCVQGLTEPLGIGTRCPVFSYTLQAEGADQCQTAWQILVSEYPKQLEEGCAELWDSGWQEGHECFGIRYAGKALASRQKLYWKVRVWDQDGHCSDWSEPSFWEMGLLEQTDWKGCWIGRGEDQTEHLSDVPVLMQQFDLDDPEEIQSVRAYISGLGLFYAFLNDMPLSDAFFEPGESDATKSVYYVTYDLGAFVRKGRNTFTIWLGNGQYSGYSIHPVMVLEDGSRAPEGRYQKNDSCHIKAGLCGKKKALVQIEVLRKDGSRQIAAASGTDWLLGSGPTIFQNWYGGEDYDAGTVTEEWIPAKQMDAPRGRMTARECQPILPYERIPAASVTKLPNGNYLVDMGTNGAGVPELYLEHTEESMRGRWIYLYPAEVCKEDGSGVDQQSCTQSWNERYDCEIRDSYRIAGTGTERWHPRFCYHGFRYLEVEGFPYEPTCSSFSCLRMRAAAPKRGSFRSSNEIVNGITTITERSIASNMFWSFTDCPQIEKLGWIETSHLMFRSVAAVHDIRAWMKKIIHDICDAQLDEKLDAQDEMEEEGFVPGIIPEFYRIKGLYRDPNWNGACVMTPWEHYQYYKDVSVLEEAFPVMERYLAYLSRHLVNGVLDGYAQMGEWGEFGEHTPTVLVATCAYYRMLCIAAKSAEILHEGEKQKQYEAQAEQVRCDFHRHPECYDAKSRRYGTGSQASWGCAVFSGIAKGEQKEWAVEQLAQTVAASGYHLTSGEVGLRQVFSALAENGRSDVVYRMIMNETAPSYRFFIDQGLTTLPEYWNYEELWHGMVRSRNHAMMGHVREWLLCYLLGIAPEKAGWETIRICPYIPEDMDWAEGSVFTPWGEVWLRWEKQDGQIWIEANIPAGMTAKITREQKAEEIGSGKYRWSM